MTITCYGPGATIDEQSCLPWTSLYTAFGSCIRIGGILADRGSATMSVLAVTAQEEDLTPYQCVHAGRVLAFWDDPGEDVYSLDDGQPV
jgi:hypothetical protein